MTDEHPTVGDLERYVIGAGTPAEASKIEAHVAHCAVCATALASEARLEMKLQEVARSTPPVAIHRKARRVAIIGGIGVLACAAALLVVPFVRTPQEAPDDPAPVSVDADKPSHHAGIACIDPATEQRCMRDARRRGLIVTYPTSQVPRYEYAAADHLVTPAHLR